MVRIDELNTMGLFDFFSSERRRREAVFGRPPKRFRGSARQMGIVLIETWKVYCETHPDFNPAKPDFIGRHDALRWVCLKIGYDESWADVYCNKKSLGTLAHMLLGCDLLYGNHDLKRYGKALDELYQCFREFLPAEMGELESERNNWQNSARLPQSN